MCAGQSLGKSTVFVFSCQLPEGEVKVRSFNDAIAACGELRLDSEKSFQHSVCKPLCHWQTCSISANPDPSDSYTVTYTAAITACGQSQRWQHALLLFSALRASNLEAGAFHTMQALSVCGIYVALQKLLYSGSHSSQYLMVPSQ